MKSKKKILINFGLKVREIRKEKGLSQEELAHKADLHRTYIGVIELNPLLVNRLRFFSILICTIIVRLTYLYNNFNKKIKLFFRLHLVHYLNLLILKNLINQVMKLI